MGFAHKINLLFTAWNPSEILPQKDPAWIVLGRSNVGKSSLLNALTHPTQVFKVGARPGLTQGIICAEIWLGTSEKSKFELLDTPGFGFTKKPAAGDRWVELLTELKNRGPKEQRRWLWLVHADRDPDEMDFQLADWLQGEDFHLLLTKADRFKTKERESLMLGWLKKFRGLQPDKVLWVSGKSGEGTDVLGKLAKQFVKACREGA